MNVDTQQGRLLAGESREYRLGETIAEGGEGIVYRVQGRDDVVAKLYREWQPGRAEKLTHLIARLTKPLTQIAAWPLSRLTDDRDEVVGFVMERLEHGFTPLHRIYQIRSRLEWAPSRDYQFLIRVARNVAACVHHVHEANIIIGDLNESNVLIGRDAMAKLLDVDSFQIVQDGVLYPCKVGKGELIAPELQGRSFENLERAPRHDEFALAVLIFQTLVFGRHPFAGRPQIEEEITLEQAITRGWYPYSTRRSVPIEPPPHLTLSFLPPQIREMFEDAFDPEHPARPTAHQWFEALKSFESDLINCDLNGGHAYWEGCPECPWCELESKWNIPLFLPSLPTLISEAGKDVEETWERAKRIPAPSQYQPPAVVIPDELPPYEVSRWLKLLRSPAFREFPWFTIIPLAIGTRMLWSSTNWTVAIVGIVVAVVFASQFLLASPGQRKVRRSLRALERLRDQWESEANPKVFEDAKYRLSQIRARLEDPNLLLEAARKKRIQEIYAPQLNRYLKKYSILAADINPPIPTSKRDLLSNEGFQTAADILDNAIAPRSDAQELFWEGLREWRNRLEETFWSTSNFSLSPNDERAVMLNLQREASALREELAKSEENLLFLRERLEQSQKKIHEEAETHLAVINRYGPRLMATNDWPES